MLKWLDALPWVFLIPIAVFLAIAPPTGPEPFHLYQKLMMLMDGTLGQDRVFNGKTISGYADIGDLIMHSAPIFLIILKAIHEFGGGKKSDAGEGKA